MARMFCALLVLLALTAVQGSERADEALDACGLPKGYYPVSHCFNVWIPALMESWIALRKARAGGMHGEGGLMQRVPVIAGRDAPHVLQPWP